MNYDDLIGKVTRWGVTTINSGDKPEAVRYLITDVDDNGTLVGVCVNEDPALHGLIRVGMDPERVRRGLTQVISIESERAKRQAASVTGPDSRPAG